MYFSDFLDNEEPAFDVFTACHEIVFSGSNGNTEYLERISCEARLVYLLWCFDGEVHNGGFDQLFFNSLGDHCLEILPGLKKVNAKKTFALLEKALLWFPESKPSKDRKTRWKQLERYEDDENFESALENLDTEFYKYEDNLAEILHNFVRANKGASVNA
ncbi:uncharacterized protein DUF4375 [Alteromonadaceae bacterium 2753L.S.0a.02]|nr:uncharacterized protein DUF4375 [Alteromonadaceae bacterium 2753L.S.0a.02]